MLRPDDTTTKGRPAPKPPAPARPPVPQRCALCGGPCAAAALATEPAWEVQDCPCSGRQRRRAGKGAP